MHNHNPYCIHELSVGLGFGLGLGLGLALIRRRDRISLGSGLCLGWMGGTQLMLSFNYTTTRKPTKGLYGYVSSG